MAKAQKELGPLKAEKKEASDNIPATARESLTLPPNFYREGFRHSMKLALLLIFVIIGLVGYIFYQRITFPKQEFYITTTDGKIEPIEPALALKKPNLSYNTVIQWATEAATAAYTLNFLDFDKDIEALRPFFTPSGFKGFKSALETSGKAKQIKEKKISLSAVRTGEPLLLQEEQFEDMRGPKSWQVQLPMLVTYQSASDRSELPVTITMLLTEVDTTLNPKGIGITQFIEQSGSIR